MFQLFTNVLRLVPNYKNIVDNTLDFILCTAVIETACLNTNDVHTSDKIPLCVAEFVVARETKSCGVASTVSCNTWSLQCDIQTTQSLLTHKPYKVVSYPYSKSNHKQQRHSLYQVQVGNYKGQNLPYHMYANTVINIGKSPYTYQESNQLGTNHSVPHGES